MFWHVVACFELAMMSISTPEMLLSILKEVRVELNKLFATLNFSNPEP